MTPSIVVALVQARMSSTRLPGKVLKPLGKLPQSATVLDHVLHQLSFARHLQSVVVVTSTEQSDDAIAEWSAQRGVSCIRGSLHDVLDRYYQAAMHLGLAAHDVVVRITADCPLIDPTVVDAVIEKLLAGNLDYCSNVSPPTFPDGLDVEAMRCSALARAWHEASLSLEREHVTPYIRSHADLFATANVTHTPSLEHLRWTLDTREDYELLCKVVQSIEQPLVYLGMRDVLAYMERHPELQALNAALKRNEEYIITSQNG
jgi:spore coat polysaccharide biosynthesis protein SpsF (cytidylyltransferase family)